MQGACVSGGGWVLGRPVQGACASGGGVGGRVGGWVSRGECGWGMAGRLAMASSKPKEKCQVLAACLGTQVPNAYTPGKRLQQGAPPCSDLAGSRTPPLVLWLPSAIATTPLPTPATHNPHTHPSTDPHGPITPTPQPLQLPLCASGGGLLTCPNQCECPAPRVCSADVCVVSACRPLCTTACA